MSAAATQNRPVAASLLLMAALVSVATMDAAAKILSASLPVMQVNWARFFFHLLTVTPLLLLTRLLSRLPLREVAREQRRHLPLHVLRGLMLGASSFCFFFAISNNPVPDALAIFFVEPLIVMLLARLFIGERFDARLLVAAVGGLAGVLIILRPGFAVTGYNWEILFALGAAFFFAVYIVSARHAIGHAPAAVISWTTALFGLLPVSFLAPLVWQTPTLDDWLLMAVVGALSGIGHTLLILSVRYASASYIAVLQYAEVPIAALISWYLFMHLPDGWVWAGIVLIACANLYALRARRGS